MPTLERIGRHCVFRYGAEQGWCKRETRVLIASLASSSGCVPVGHPQTSTTLEPDTYSVNMNL